MEYLLSLNEHDINEQHSNDILLVKRTIYALKNIVKDHKNKAASASMNRSSSTTNDDDVPIIKPSIADGLRSKQAAKSLPLSLTPSSSTSLSSSKQTGKQSSSSARTVSKNNKSVVDTDPHFLYVILIDIVNLVHKHIIATSNNSGGHDYLSDLRSYMSTTLKSWWERDRKKKTTSAYRLYHMKTIMLLVSSYIESIDKSASGLLLPLDFTSSMSILDNPYVELKASDVYAMLNDMKRMEWRRLMNTHALNSEQADNLNRKRKAYIVEDNCSSTVSVPRSSGEYRHGGDHHHISSSMEGEQRLHADMDEISRYHCTLEDQYLTAPRIMKAYGGDHLYLNELWSKIKGERVQLLKLLNDIIDPLCYSGSTLIET